MPTATRYITPTATITGTTPDPDSAPTTYSVTINGQTVSGLSADDNITVTNVADSNGLQSTLSTLQIGQTTISIPSAQASSVVSNLGIAFQSVNKSIITQATSGTDPNSMSSSGNPPQLIEAQTTNIPPDQIDGLADYQKVNPDTGQIYYGAPPLDPKELGYQSSVYNGPVTQSPPQIPLPMGTAISDIYDPNLTPEQVASLQPNEQQLRAEELGYTYTGPAVTGLATENPDGSLTVTAKAQATAQDQSDYASQQDWRVRLKLAPGSNYLYNAPNPGILGPLASKGGTDGVIFPYTPGINITYSADYQSENLTHTNYTINQYKASHVDAITITAEFTAQDVFEANYLLAVIHFFKSATKMFYGQDSNPKNGTPPPLCYLFGYGGWQFDNHPLAIQQFSYNLPPDVDYIRTTGPSAAGTVQPTVKNNTTNGSGGAASRLPPNINPGGTAPPPNFPNTPASANVPNTWVPTKIQMSITCVPIISRNNVSNIFSLQDYAAGSLTPAVNKTVNTGFW
jgi:hypothetical protein